MYLSALDAIIVGAYAVMLVALSVFVSREKKGHQKGTEDYFLASRALPWWAVGASLIASNISAEQIIGMSGSGYVVGLAIASYEWMAAITLIIVGKYMLPIFLARQIHTMPQFLEQRFDNRVRTVMAVFWIGVYIFVNLTSVLWLGATAIEKMAGIDVMYGVVALALISVAYSLYGGLKAVAFTDIIQVAMIVIGGVLITFLALEALGGDGGPVTGFQTMLERAPEKFDMILSAEHPEYMNLPGLGVLIGGLWVMNFSYWGFNQYIIQRALGAKDQGEAQKGIVFAAFLKLLMPLIIVVPGIAAFLLAADGSLTGIERPDQAYPALLGLAPEGLRGLIFAGLLAAIVSSLGSMMNSISTIFTLDLYRPAAPSTSEARLVLLGRIAGVVSITIAVVMARPLLGQFDQAFQYIQEFTGFFTPGICAIFLLGLFWKRATANGALAAGIGSAAFSVLAKILLPTVPFMDRVGYVFLACCALMMLTSLAERAPALAPGAGTPGASFKTSAAYNFAAAVVVAILITLYAVFW